MTEVTLIHAGWRADGKTKFGQPHTSVRERMGQGWIGLLEALKAHVEGEESSEG